MARYIASFALLLGIWAFGLVYYYQIMDLAKQDKMIVEILLLFLVVVLLFRTVSTIIDFSKFMAKRKEAGEKGESFSSALRRVLKRKETIFLAATAPYIALFPIIGFFVTSFFYVMAANILLGTKGKLKLVAIPAGVTLFTYLLFVLVFDIRFPKGILF